MKYIEIGKNNKMNFQGNLILILRKIIKKKKIC